MGRGNIRAPTHFILYAFITEAVSNLDNTVSYIYFNSLLSLLHKAIQALEISW